MNRTQYQQTRRFIRDNGIRYTYANAIDTDNYDTMFLCEDLMDVGKQTDWLAMRQDFARNTPASIAFKLTTKA